MRKTALIIMMALMIASVSVYAIEEVEWIETDTLTAGNGICEIYEHEFDVEETDIVSINGETLNIKFLRKEQKADGYSDSYWKINDYEGIIKNHDFFRGNSKEALRGANFNFYGEDHDSTKGQMSFAEYQYYPYDCLGYHRHTGLVVELDIVPGWNLVPYRTTLRDCYYARQDELCKDDILAEYIYITTTGEYLDLRDDNALQEKYPTEEALLNSPEGTFLAKNGGIRFTSKWIYVKESAEDKKMADSMSVYIPNREEYLQSDEYEFNLFEGWNFLSIQPFMSYNDDWEEVPLSFKDMAGDCEIESIYSFSPDMQRWEKVSQDTEIESEGIGVGVIVKVSEDCTLSISETIGNIEPPAMPN